MHWKYSAAKQLWTFGDYAIQLEGSVYELYHLATFVKPFTSCEAAKQHAKGMAYQAGEIRGRGRPKSEASCPDCGAPPSHQQRATTTPQ